jgi:hypothetical protein
VRMLVALAGVLGGLAWVAALVLHQLDRAAAADAAQWVGLPLLLVAAVAAGASLVTRTTAWLRVVAGVCFALLAWSVLELVADAFDEHVVRALVGAVVALLSAAVVARRPAPGSPVAAQRHRGTHAR